MRFTELEDQRSHFRLANRMLSGEEKLSSAFVAPCRRSVMKNSSEPAEAPRGAPPLRAPNSNESCSRFPPDNRRPARAIRPVCCCAFPLEQAGAGFRTSAGLRRCGSAARSPQSRVPTGKRRRVYLIESSLLWPRGTRSTGGAVREPAGTVTVHLDSSQGHGRVPRWL